MDIPITLYNDIVAFFLNLPNVDDREGRRALLYQAGIDTQFLHHITWNAPSAKFFPVLVTQLFQYGTLQDGRDALEAVLEATKIFIGEDKKTYCDILIQKLRNDRATRISSQVETELKTLGIEPSTVPANDEEEPQKRTDGNTHIGDVSDNVNIDQARSDIVGGDKIGGDKLTLTVGDISSEGSIAIGKEIHQTSVFHGISEERFEYLVEELAVTKSALKSFFKILEQQQVPLEDLDSKLREIAKNYNELLQKLEIIYSDDPIVQDLKSQAYNAIEHGEFEQAERFLNQAEGREVEVIQQLEAEILQKQGVLEKRQLSAAEINADNGQLQFTQLAYIKAAKYYQKAVELLPDGHDELLSKYLNKAGETLYFAGKYTQAISLMQRALTIQEPILGPDHPDVATTLSKLGVLYRDMGEYRQALPCFERALKIQEPVFGPNYPGVATTLSNLGGLYIDMGEYEQALPCFERALKIQEAVLGPNHPDVAITLNNLGLLYQSMGEYGQALPCFDRVLKIQVPIVGPDHPGVATTLSNLGGLYIDMKVYEQALFCFERALKIQEAVLGPNHPGVATMLNNLGELYRAMGEYGQALPYFERALTIQEPILGPNHPGVATMLNNLGSLYRDMGKHKQAQSLYKRALRIIESVLGPNHPDVATMLNNLGVLYCAIGAYKQAIPLLKRALIIYRTVFGNNHLYTAIALNKLAQLYYDIGAYQEALPLLMQAEKIFIERKGNNHPSTKEVRNTIQNIKKGDKTEKSGDSYPSAKTISDTRQDHKKCKIINFSDYIKEK